MTRFFLLSIVSDLNLGRHQTCVKRENVESRVFIEMRFTMNFSINNILVILARIKYGDSRYSCTNKVWSQIQRDFFKLLCFDLLTKLIVTI